MAANIWNALIKHQKERRAPPNVLKIIRNAAFQNAFIAPPDPGDQKLQALLNCVMSAQTIVGRESAKTTNSLVADVKKMEKDKCDAIEHLRAAAALLRSKYAPRLAALIFEIETDRGASQTGDIAAILLDPNLMGRRGRASASTRSALIGWIVKSIAPHVARNVSNRSAVIAGLLELRGLSNVRPQTLTKILEQR